MGIIALIVALILVLPYALESAAVRRVVLQRVGQAVNGTAGVDTLVFSWADGLKAEGVRIHSGSMGLDASLQTLETDVEWSALFRGTVSVVFRAAGLHGELKVPRPAGNDEDVEPFVLPPLPVATGIVLPGWLEADASLNEMDFTLLHAGRRLDFAGFEGRARVFGSAQRAAVSLDGEYMGPVSMAATFDDGTLKASVILPGVDARLESSRAGLSARVTARLEKATALAVPFMPEGLPALGGDMSLNALAEPVQNGLGVSLQLAGRSVRADGGPLPASIAIPEMTMACSGTISRDGSLDISKGSASLPGVETGFSAVLHPDGQRWEATLNGVKLDLSELIKLAGPMLPQGISLDSGLAGVASIRAAGSLSGGIPASEVEGLHLQTGPIAYGDVMSLAGLDVALDSASVATRAGLLADALGVSVDLRGVRHSLLPQPLDASFRANVNGLTPLGSTPGVEKFELTGSVNGPTVSFGLGGSMGGGSGRRFDLKGRVDGDLGRLANLLRMPLTSGTASIELDANGSIPDPAAVPVSIDLSALPQLLEQLAFLEKAELVATLRSVRGVAAVAGNVELDTLEPVRLRLQKGLQSLQAEGVVTTRSDLLPEQVRSSFSFDLEGLDRAKWTFDNAIPGMNAFLESSGQLEGLMTTARAVAQKEDPLGVILSKLSGEVVHSLWVQPGGAVAEGVRLEGAASLDSRVRLQAGKLFAADLDMRFDGFTASAGAFALNKLGGELSVARRLPIVGSRSPRRVQPGLSRRVLGQNGKRIETSVPLVVSEAEGLRFARAAFSGAAIPLEMEHGFFVPEIGDRIGLSRFGMDILGGSIRGSAMLRERAMPTLELETVFTNVDFARLLDTAPADDASVDGRLRLSLPVTENSGRMLEEVRLTALMPHIGSGTLDSLLAAMDPDGADPAIAAQRRMVAMGGPRNIAIRIRGGNLSIDGEVEAFGIRLKLPPVRRVSLAALPVHDMLAPLADALGSFRRAVRLWRAEAVRIGPEGIELVTPEIPQR